ncbi:hypothetical protein PsAD13_03886 [Pseudovibrio sp. Ad13]|uniref:hypothetical protein n=1 Tax=Pseudovibrio sp. Ad13 TaxID=989396 RepID=UPI0007AE3FB0|nr:hypothetical protein [Pseudovibrio sp. Ad13]KZK82327.1 hypothetical protein PsAD13_03886 [Pseudovibrio sp. Ad13]
MEFGSGVKDVIELDLAVFVDFDTVLANAVNVGDNTVITLDEENSITLQEVNVEGFYQDDFLFV